MGDNRVRHSPFPIVMGPLEDQAAHLVQICRVLGPACSCSLVGSSASVSPHGTRLVDSVGLLLCS